MCDDMRKKPERVRKTLRLFSPTLAPRRVLNIADSPPTQGHCFLKGRNTFGLKSVFSLPWQINWFDTRKAASVL